MDIQNAFRYDICQQKYFFLNYWIDRKQIAQTVYDLLSVQKKTQVEYF